MIKDSKHAGALTVYFVYAGFMSLVMWNSLLNLIEYIDKSVEENFFTVLMFMFSIGQIASLLGGQAIIGKFNNRILMQIALICAAISFFFFTVYAKYPNGAGNLIYRKITTSVLVFLLGFFNTVFQSILMSLASSISNDQIICVNFGTGLSGVLTNLFAFTLEKLIPNQVNDQNHALMIRSLIYVLFLLCLATFFLVCQRKFNKDYPDAQNLQREDRLQSIIETGDTINQSVELSTIEVIAKTVRLLIGTFFLYVITISFLGYLVIKASIFYDSANSFFTVPFFLFCFNITDTVGKFIPSRYLLSSEQLIQIANVSRFLVWVYFYLLVFNSSFTNELSSPWIRLVCCLIMGLMNGWLTNCYFAKAADQFAKASDKGRAGYFTLFSLVLGVVMGTCVGIALEKIN